MMTYLKSSYKLIIFILTVLTVSTVNYMGQRYLSTPATQGMDYGVNFGIPWAESVQLCERGRTHPFCEEKPCFGFVSASREM